MFGLEAVPELPYRDPWLLPLAERIRLLHQGTRRVAYFKEEADNSTFRYRVYNMAQVLNESPEGVAGRGGDASTGGSSVSASWFYLADLPELPHLSQWADLLVICRTRYDHRVAQLVASFHARGKRVLYDTDDLVFNPDYAHLLITTLDLDARDPRVWDDWYAYTSRLGATLKLCDGAITTTPALAAQLRAVIDKPVAIVPNFLNREQVEVSERVFAAKRQQQPGHSGHIHLGYFSGSPSHNRDFAMVLPALQTLLDEDERLAVTVVGYIEPGPLLQRFGKRVQRLPFQDYVNLQRCIGAVEYNLMPLQYNVFTHCKSELKYFDAALVGSLSIASPTATYRAAIDHGRTGWLAASHEWLDVLRKALAEHGRYQAMASSAHEDARAKYLWHTQRPAILAALGLD